MPKPSYCSAPDPTNSQARGSLPMERARTLPNLYLERPPQARMMLVRLLCQPNHPVSVMRQGRPLSA